MSEHVQYFIFNFCHAITEGALLEIQNMYENTFPQLTDHYFDNTSWPDWKDLAELVDSEKKFGILYKELYFRHIHSRIQGGPTLEERIGSFYNYCDFFNMLLTPRKPVQMNLPDIWLWELVDEFIQQFESFSRFRSFLSAKNDDEMIEFSASHSNEWSILCVLNVLHSLIEISDVRIQLKVIADGLEPKAVAGEFGRLPLYRMLGYFSLVGLARVHAQLADYIQVIKVVESLGVQKILEYTSIPACHISLSYYVGFAYMMMRRYVDAIAVFSESLLYAQNSKQTFSAHMNRNEMFNKQMERVFHLLAICMVLQPQRIEESLQKALRDKKYHDSILRMQAGDLEVFEAFFVVACPVFLNVYPTSAKIPIEDYAYDPLHQQLNIFLTEVRQQIKMPTLRSILKLYMSMPLDKLNSLICAQGEQRTKDETLIDLMCFKHKTFNLVRNNGLQGGDSVSKSVGELDFYLDEEMIYIFDTKVTHSHNNFFLNKILQLTELNRKLSQLKF